MTATECPSFHHDEVVEFIAAFARHAEETATIIAIFLKHWLASIGWRKRTQFPAEFLAELGAIVRIALWQRSESLSHLAAEFPPAKELFESLIERLTRDPLSFSCDVSRPYPLLRALRGFGIPDVRGTALSKLEPTCC